MRGTQPLPAVISVIAILSLTISIVIYFGLDDGSASSSLGQIEITQPVDSLAGPLVLGEEADDEEEEERQREQIEDEERELDEEAATQAAETPVP